MYKLLIIVIFSVIASCHTNDEQFSESDNEKILSFMKISVVDQIERYNRVDGPVTGYAGIKSAQYKRYEILRKYSEDSLIALTNHRSPVVRVYAFDALFEKNSQHLLQIFQDHINDTARFLEFGGCIGVHKPINIYYLKRTEGHLSKKQKIEYTQKVSSYYSPEEWKYFTLF